MRALKERPVGVRIRNFFKLVSESFQEAKELIMEFSAAIAIGFIIMLLFYTTEYFVAFPPLFAGAVIFYAYRKKKVQLLQTIQYQARISFMSFYILIAFGNVLTPHINPKHTIFFLLFPIEFFFIFWTASFLKLKLLRER